MKTRRMKQSTCPHVPSAPPVKGAGWAAQSLQFLWVHLPFSANEYTQLIVQHQLQCKGQKVLDLFLKGPYLFNMLGAVHGS